VKQAAGGGNSEGWMGRGRSRGNAVGKEEARTAREDRLMWVPRAAVEARACEARFFRYKAGFLMFDDRSGFGRANFLTYEAFFDFLRTTVL
jgi:hypothetical protein